MVEESLKNVAMEVNGDILTIKVDLSKQIGPSASGKSILIATTGGGVPIEGGAKVNLSVYTKAK